MLRRARTIPVRGGAMHRMTTHSSHPTSRIHRALTDDWFGQLESGTAPDESEQLLADDIPMAERGEPESNSLGAWLFSEDEAPETERGVRDSIAEDLGFAND